MVPERGGTQNNISVLRKLKLTAVQRPVRADEVRVITPKLKDNFGERR